MKSPLYHPEPFGELSTDVPSAREFYCHSVFVLEHMLEFFPGGTSIIGNCLLETIKQLEVALDSPTHNQL